MNVPSKTLLCLQIVDTALSSFTDIEHQTVAWSNDVLKSSVQLHPLMTYPSLVVYEGFCLFHCLLKTDWDSLSSWLLTVHLQIGWFSNPWYEVLLALKVEDHHQSILWHWLHLVFHRIFSHITRDIWYNDSLEWNLHSYKMMESQIDWQSLSTVYYSWLAEILLSILLPWIVCTDLALYRQFMGLWSFQLRGPSKMWSVSPWIACTWLPHLRYCETQIPLVK